MFLTSHTRERMASHETERRLKRKNHTIGLYNGILNPLTSNWTFPKGIRMINLINMWIRGSTTDNVLPFLYLGKDTFAHIKIWCWYFVKNEISNEKG